MFVYRSSASLFTIMLTMLKFQCIFINNIRTMHFVHIGLILKTLKSADGKCRISLYTKKYWNYNQEWLKMFIILHAKCNLLKFLVTSKLLFIRRVQWPCSKCTRKRDNQPSHYLDGFHTIHLVCSLWQVHCLKYANHWCLLGSYMCQMKYGWTQEIYFKYLYVYLNQLCEYSKEYLLKSKCKSWTKTATKVVKFLKLFIWQI